MKSTILSLLLCLFIFSSFAQELNPCGTTDGRSEWLKDFQAGKIPVTRAGGDWLIIPIYAHITGENNGSGYTSTQLVGESIKIMNEAFAQAKMQFFLAADYNFIDNSSYHNHETFTIGRQMMRNNNVSNVINIYFCSDAAGNCGYYTGGQDAIAINNDCLDPLNHTLAHEMGHLLSLPHPFVGWEGTDYDDSQPTPEFVNGAEVEKTDRSNCTTAGDGFCGTEADYLSYRWPCGSNGVSSLTQFDPDGVPFNSQGNIIMSYSTGECRDKFTEDQIDAMCTNVTDQRASILNHPREFQELTRCGRVAQYEPAHNEQVQFDDVLLTWENIPGVDHFTLQVSKNINFTDLIVDVQINDTSYTLPVLDLDRTYFWQVNGFAAHSPCINLSAKRWLKTVDFSATIDLENDGQISTYFSDEALMIQSTHVNLSGSTVELYDLSGRVVLIDEIIGSSEILSYSTHGLSSGIYLVRIVNPAFEIAAKVIK